MEGVSAKVLPRLNEVMKQFISRSPPIFVSTIDANGHSAVSPKGDPAGFIEVRGDGARFDQRSLKRWTSHLPIEPFF